MNDNPPQAFNQKHFHEVAATVERQTDDLLEASERRLLDSKAIAFGLVVGVLLVAFITSSLLRLWRTPSGFSTEILAAIIVSLSSFLFLLLVVIRPLRREARLRKESIQRLKETHRDLFGTVERVEHQLATVQPAALKPQGATPVEEENVSQDEAGLDVEKEIVVRMSPKTQRRVKVRVRNLGRAEPRVVYEPPLDE